MFGSSKKSNGAGKPAMPASISLALNSLVQGTEFEGNVKAKTDFRVDGIIKGDLSCESKVIIGPGGTVEGTVDCRNAVIEGKFDGVLRVAELLNIRETANVVGKVTYGNLIVQSGAVISGSFKVVAEEKSTSIEQLKVESKSKSAGEENGKGKATEVA